MAGWRGRDARLLWMQQAWETQLGRSRSGFPRALAAFSSLLADGPLPLPSTINLSRRSSPINSLPLPSLIAGRRLRGVECVGTPVSCFDPAAFHPRSRSSTPSTISCHPLLPTTHSWSYEVRLTHPFRFPAFSCADIQPLTKNVDFGDFARFQFYQPSVPQNASGWMPMDCARLSLPEYCHFVSQYFVGRPQHPSS